MTPTIISPEKETCDTAYFKKKIPSFYLHSEIGTE